MSSSTIVSCGGVSANLNHMPKGARNPSLKASKGTQNARNDEVLEQLSLFSMQIER